MSAGCNRVNTDMKQFHWLEGRWEGDYGGMQTFEEWKPVNENLMHGFGGVLSNRDTMFAEEIKMEIKNGSLFYVAVVPEISGPIAFKLIKSDKDSVVFENLEHDFPKRIIYIKRSSDSLSAHVEGIKSGKASRKEFEFKKVKGL